MTEYRDNQAEESGREWLSEGLESQQTSRRQFLGRLTGLFAVAAAGALGGSEVNAKVRKKPQQQTATAKDTVQKQTDVSIEKVDDHTFTIGKWEAEKNGEGLRGASERLPENWDLRLVTFENDIVVEGRRKIIKLQYLLPLVRDLGECARHMSTLKVGVTGMTNPKISIKPIVSEPNHNQFLEIELEGRVDPGHTHVTMHPTLTSWVTQASKPAVVGPQLLQNHGSSPLLQTAMATYAQTKSNMVYDASVWSIDPKEIHGRGDCGSFSVFGKYASNGAMEVVMGYSEACIDENESKHCWNVSRAGGWVADTPKNYVGPDNESFVPALVGNEFQFPKNTAYGRQVKRHQVGMNTGFLLTYGIGITGSTNDSVRFSTPGHGIRGQELQQLALQPPADIKAAHDVFVAERKRINQHPQAAANVAKRK